MKRVIFLLTFAGITTILQAQVSKTLNVTAGGLYAALTATERNTITNLTLTGTIDARDFKTMRDAMTVLADVDLSGAAVVAYTGSGGTKDTVTRTYPAHMIPESAFNIAGSAQGKKSLKKIILPSAVISTGASAFYKCTGLTSITNPATLLTIGNNAFEFCESLNAVNFPASLSEIGSYAFKNCIKLTTLALPSSLQNIRHSAFKFCTSLSSVDLPSLVTKIDSFVFSSCVVLISVTLPSSVTTIGKGAFENCIALNSITLPSSVTSIEAYAFSNCQALVSVTLPVSLKSIGDYAFQVCPALKAVNIPASVNSIGTGPFRGNSGSITVDSGNLNYSVIDGVLYDKTQTGIIQCPVSKRGVYNMPLTVTTIGGSAFYQCSSLTSVPIPAAVTYIGSSAFEYCTGLTSVNIPAGVTGIALSAFYNCIKVKSVYAYPRIPVALGPSTNVFYGINKSTCVLYVPYGSKPLYQSSDQWRNFTDIREMQGFSLSAYTIILESGQGSTGTIAVSSNVNWSAKSDKSWLSVNPASGNGTTTMVLTAEINTENTSRTANVVFSSTGLDPLVLEVIQRDSLSSQQIINLSAGWNISSFNVIPENADMKVLFLPLINDGSLIKIQDETGNSLEDLGLFGGWVNNIGNMNLTEGYKIKVSRNCQIIVPGDPCILPFEIPLKTGWNIIGFPRNTVENALKVIQQLIDRKTLVKVQDEKGNAIEDLGFLGGWTNFIGNFLPGKGYKIKVVANETLTVRDAYPGP